jgi:phospholipid/cholesterol/gamma-HCH transport system permease protein
MTAAAPERDPVTRLGDAVLGAVDQVGRFALLAVRTPGGLLRRGFRLKDVVLQFDAIVARSTTIVSITALFTGMVLALQTVNSLARFGAKPYTGSFVGLAFVLELGPVLTALVVAGRVGAGITAEIGSMAVTEQVDAIRAMGADPIQKLVLPRVIALTLGLPMLAVLADLLGTIGGMLIATQYGIGLNFYYQSVVKVVGIDDLLNGLVKTFFFGWVISMVGCHLGLRTTGGTVGVGRATTTAVVVSSIAVLVSDFFLTKLLLVFQA